MNPLLSTKNTKCAICIIPPINKLLYIETIQQIINITLGNINKDSKTFHPHLTVGQCKKGELPVVLQKLETEFEDHQFIYVCDSVHIIERGDDTPFQIKKTIKLKCIQ